MMRTVETAIQDIQAPLLYRGKVRELFDLGEELLLVVTDRLSAHDLRLQPPIPGKGDVLNRLAEYWFEKTAPLQPNHLIHTDVQRLVEIGVLDGAKADLYRDRITVGRKAERIDIECVARGYLTGGGWRQYEETGQVNGIELGPGIRKNERLTAPIFTPAAKNEVGHDEDLTFEELVERVGDESARALREATLRLYDFAEAACREQGILLADCKLEFGRIDGELVLIDECFTPDSSRFWAREDYELDGEIDSFDKEPVRQYLLQVQRETGAMPTTLPATVVEETSRRYQAIFERLTK